MMPSDKQDFVEMFMQMVSQQELPQENITWDYFIDDN